MNTAASLPIQDCVQAIERWHQACLTNAVRHGQASSVRVAWEDDLQGTTLAIEDDGVGFDPKSVPAGKGLQSLEMRCQLIGGNLRIDSVPIEGSRVTLNLPFSPSNRSPHVH